MTPTNTNAQTDAMIMAARLPGGTPLPAEINWPGGTPLPLDVPEEIPPAEPSPDVADLPGGTPLP